MRDKILDIHTDIRFKHKEQREAKKKYRNMQIGI